MPRWDFHCDVCGTTKELAFPSVDQTESVKCQTCGGILKRLPSAASFTVSGYSYKNGYSK